MITFLSFIKDDLTYILRDAMVSKRWLGNQRKYPLGEATQIYSTSKGANLMKTVFVSYLKKKTKKEKLLKLAQINMAKQSQIA